MLETLTEKLESALKRLSGRGILTEDHLRETLREVRLALLEADVHFRVVKDFCDRVAEKALGEEVLKSLTPGQQVIKIVHAELTALLGGAVTPLSLASSKPTIIVLVGLQGSGKTTTAGKLARFFLGQGKRILLVAADVRRPAAAEQLRILGGALSSDEVRTVVPDTGESAVAICIRGVRDGGDSDVVIIDTAGRLHVDEALLSELSEIERAVRPHRTLLVADAMTGQDAVRVAEKFSAAVSITGMILTKAEGDARGGAILSMRAVIGKPVLFIGTGERLDALEPFYPDRFASRILGMGDVLTLIERAGEAVSQENAERLAKKIARDEFSLEDFAEQIKQVGRLGSLSSIVKMIPGARKISSEQAEEAEREMHRILAILGSMTRDERRRPQMIDGSRRKRIARGSGTEVFEVNRLLKQFLQARKMMKQFSRGGSPLSLFRGGGRSGFSGIGASE